MHPYIVQVIMQYLGVLLLLLIMAHGLFTMIGMKKVIPKFLKGLLTGFGRWIKWGFTQLARGVVWLIRWFVGLIRDGVVAAYRGLRHGRRRRRGRRRRS